MFLACLRQPNRVEEAPALASGPLLKVRKTCFFHLHLLPLSSAAKRAASLWGSVSERSVKYDDYESVSRSVVSDCDPMDCSPTRLLCPWNFLQARTDRTESPLCVSWIAGGFLTAEPSGNPIIYVMRIILNMKYMCILT